MSAYIEIGKINGNVSAKGLENQIEVKKAEFSVKRNMNTKPGSVSNREGTKPAMSELTVTKMVDSASPALFNQSTVGSSIAELTLRFYNTGANLSEYHSVTLKNVLVSGYDMAYDETMVPEGEVREVRPMERVTFNYTHIEVKNTPHDKEGKSGSPIAVGYDLETATAA